MNLTRHACLEIHASSSGVVVGVMTGNITSIRVVDSSGAITGRGAIGASDHKESQGVWDGKDNEEKGKGELIQCLIAIKVS